jgi:hypothetical protein
MASCALQPGNFRPVGNGSIHCSCYIRMKGRHQDRQLHATVAANRDSGTCCVRRRLSPRTHVVHAPPLSLFLSLHQCNLLPLSDKRESRVLSSLWLTFYVFLLSSPWRERLSHFFPSSTFSHLWLKSYRDLGPSSLSRPIYPYYKSAQITQQHIGRYSPKVRTSINLVCPPFAQPFEARHAIREIICRRLQNPNTWRAR